MHIRVSALILLMLSFVHFGAAAGDQFCQKDRASGYGVNWCFERGDAASDQVIYYFHGLGHTEADWWKTDMRDAVQRAGGLRPHVFSISFGRAWIFTDLRLFGKSRIQAFLEDIMPVLESRLPSTVSSRVLMGESMGGLNAIRLAMAAPTRFSKVIAMCPAITEIGPHSSRAEVEGFLSRNPFVNAGQVRGSQWLMMAEYPTPEVWFANAPLKQSDETLAALPPVFISEDEKDDYGFPEGIEIFANRLRGLGKSVTVFSGQEGHCHHSQQALDAAGQFLNSPPVRTAEAHGWRAPSAGL